VVVDVEDEHPANQIMPTPTTQPPGVLFEWKPPLVIVGRHRV